MKRHLPSLDVVLHQTGFEPVAVELSCQDLTHSAIQNFLSKYPMLQSERTQKYASGWAFPHTIPATSYKIQQHLCTRVAVRAFKILKGQHNQCAQVFCINRVIFFAILHQFTRVQERDSPNNHNLFTFCGMT
jgi:hypothetical protein